VWIDHNTFYPANDGSVDVKRGSDLVTVSYNRYVGTDKSMLLGHSDSDGAQDRGFLRVTYLHNWFDGSNTRHPRVRFGYAHVYANYIAVDDYFIGLGVGGQTYAESN
jgi:pectate lyase